MKKATDAQIWKIKKLGREMGLVVDGDARSMDHVLCVATYGRTSHWASLTVPGAIQAINRLLDPEFAKSHRDWYASTRAAS